MARYLPVLRLLLLFHALGGAWPRPAVAAEAPERLVNANFNSVPDKRGNRWDINQMGAISDGTNDCFDNGGVLQLEGNAVSFSRPMMTPDGQEYVFTTRHRQVNVTRRVRLDLEHGAVRYLEIFEGVGGAPVKLQASIHTDLGNNASRVLDVKDKPFAGTLGKDDGLFMTIGADSRPGVVFLVADPKAKVKPQIRINGNRSFDIVYSLDIPKGGSVAVVHYMAQRLNGTVADARELLATYYKHGRLTDPALPKAYEKLIANFSVGRPTEGEEKSTPLLAPLQELAESNDIARGKADTVLLDAGSKLAGTITGSDFEIETLFGKAPIAFAEIAGVEGGANVLRPIRVFLRNGEILSGAVKAAKVAMTTESGLSVDLDLGQINLLTMRVGELDGIAPPNSSMLVTTEQGDRLALGEGAAPLDVATPWGMAKVPLAEVRSLTTVREPFPAHRLTLGDRSRFVAMLRGTEWTAPTVRFGPLKMPPQSLREMQSLAAAPTAEPAEGEAPVGGPLCELLGESRVAGVIDLPQLHLVAESSVTPIEPKQIVLIESEVADDGGRVFTVKLADGQELKGRLTENILPIRAGDRLWHVPAAHLVAYRLPQADAADEKPAKEAAPVAPRNPLAPIP